MNALIELIVTIYPFALAVLIVLCLIGAISGLLSKNGDKASIFFSCMACANIPLTLLIVFLAEYDKETLFLIGAGVTAFLFLIAYVSFKREARKEEQEKAEFYAKHPESKIWGHFNIESMPDAPYFSGLIQCVHVSYRHTKKNTYMQSHSRFAGREREESKTTRSVHFKPSEFRAGNQNIEMEFDNGMTVHIVLPYTVNKSGNCENPVSAGYVEFRDEERNDIKIPVYIW